MTDYPEKPKRGSYEPLDFVSPSPLDGCITLLKRQAYDVWGDQFRLNVDSITPDEWVIQVFAPESGDRSGEKLVEGRLIANESGGTQVTIREVSVPSGTQTLPILLTMLVVCAAVLLIKRADILTLVTLVAIGFLMITAIVKFPNVSLPHPKAGIVLGDIERLLKR